MNPNAVRLNALAGIALATLTLAAIAQAPPAAPLVTHQLTPNVYWIEGAGGNSTVIVGTHGVIVVDTKVTKAAGHELIEDIAKITPKPITTVILTHSDGDHINGLAAFPPGLKIIAQVNDKKEQEAAIASGAPGAPTPDRLPNQLVDRHATLTLEGQKVELFHWAPAHTSGDLVVYLPAEKIVATGDIVAVNDPFPRIHEEKHGSTEGWIETAQGMVALDANTFISGHGGIQTKAKIQTRIDNAIARRNQVKQLVAQGKSLDEIKTALDDNAQRRNYKSWTEVCYDEMTKK